jgi:hypothetical protein
MLGASKLLLQSVSDSQEAFVKKVIVLVVGDFPMPRPKRTP